MSKWLNLLMYKISMVRNTLTKKGKKTQSIANFSVMSILDLDAIAVKTKNINVVNTMAIITSFWSYSTVITPNMQIVPIKN